MGGLAKEHKEETDEKRAWAEAGCVAANARKKRENMGYKVDAAVAALLLLVVGAPPAPAAPAGGKA